MNKYKLSNRYGDKNYLIPIDKNVYKLSLQYDLGARVGYDNENNICFVDPSGGPMLRIGDTLTNLGTITKIYTDLKGILLNIE